MFIFSTLSYYLADRIFFGMLSEKLLNFTFDFLVLNTKRLISRYREIC